VYILQKLPGVSVLVARLQEKNQVSGLEDVGKLLRSLAKLRCGEKREITRNTVQNTSAAAAETAKVRAVHAMLNPRVAWRLGLIPVRVRAESIGPVENFLLLPGPGSFNISPITTTLNCQQPMLPWEGHLVLVSSCLKKLAKVDQSPSSSGQHFLVRYLRSL
jgi:hypothetical protein